MIGASSLLGALAVVAAIAFGPALPNDLHLAHAKQPARIQGARLTPIAIYKGQERQRTEAESRFEFARVFAPCGNRRRQFESQPVDDESRIRRALCISQVTMSCGSGENSNFSVIFRSEAKFQFVTADHVLNEFYNKTRREFDGNFTKCEWFDSQGNVIRVARISSPRSGYGAPIDGTRDGEWWSQRSREIGGQDLAWFDFTIERDEDPLRPLISLALSLAVLQPRELAGVQLCSLGQVTALQLPTPISAVGCQALNPEKNLRYGVEIPEICPRSASGQYCSNVPALPGFSGLPVAGIVNGGVRAVMFTRGSVTVETEWLDYSPSVANLFIPASRLAPPRPW